MRRGSLRIYLGAAPGVGKTFAMLGEGNRRHQRGTDVVIGVVETHGRAHTAAEIGDLEIVPRRMVEHRGTSVSEMDLDAILARRPAVVLVDELAHTNAPGSRNEKRWQDVDELLDAGIDVISTLNIQHLASLNDVVTRITGITQRETVPDAVVRAAEQIELVDMAPEALRRRMAHGNIYPADRIDAALANYFRPGNLGALRELALLWVADRVEESLHDYLIDHGITDTWETRERVVVALSGTPHGEAVIRRAGRMAGRVRGELIGVHVTADDGRVRSEPEALEQQRRLVAELGGTAFEVVGRDRARSLVEFARSQKATQLVLGASRRSRWSSLVHGSMVASVVRACGTIDVHVIASDAADDPTPAGASLPRGGVTPRRQLFAWLLTVVGLPVVCAAMVAAREHLTLSTELLVFLAVVLGISALGGRLVSVVASVAASLLVNWYFVPPVHTLTISDGDNIVALGVFMAVAVTVGTLVDRAARRSGEALRARAEAEALVRAATSLAADPDPLPALLEQVQVTFGFESAAIVHRADGDSVVVASAGHTAETAPRTVLTIPVGTGPAHDLVLCGSSPSADGLRVLRALVDQLAVALDARARAESAADVEALAQMDTVRTALLRAVSHDLRSPLAAIKTMVSGLRDPSVPWSGEQTAEALEAIDTETDRLNRLVGNLLDASRLQSGALGLTMADVVVEDPVAAALRSLGSAGDAVVVSLAADLPQVRADSALLERVLANLIANAVRHSPDPGSVRLDAAAVGDEVHLRVIDRGPGIALTDRTRVLAPFQRLGDQRTDDGVGLGLAISVGFVEAMGGTLSLDDTPAGGLTVTIVLPAVAHRQPPAAELQPIISTEMT